ncbi:lantibiotic dehydratase [Lentzea sp. NPDC006480]|uniref:lantibiotic dehydratase n=1 Tax=Lentzea sp. NPDC006480 TaxID=3157176 RepID=UPI0033A9A9BF
MTDRVRGEAAPYALVRLATLPHPDGATASAPFRRAVEALADTESRLHALIDPLCDLLHDSASTHTSEVHRRVVLPLRGDVHNRRTTKPALRAAASSLRIPELDTWFELMDSLGGLVGEVSRLQPEALAAEREVLAPEPSRRAIGWGTWSADAPTPDWGTPVSVPQVDQLLLARLTAALVSDRTRLFDHPHRLAPGVHEDDGRTRFLRDVPASGPSHRCAEENVELASSPSLRFIIGLTSANPKGISPSELAGALATRLPDDESHRARGFVELLLDIKLLIPVLPVDPQDPAACPSLASWLRDTGRPELADRVLSLHHSTVAFGELSSSERPAALAALIAGWESLGSAVGADLTGIVPVSEDLVLPQPVRLGRAYGYDGVRSLAALTPLLMLFDRHLAIRRHVRDQFVVEFGRGGSARLAECSQLLLDALASAPSGGLGASRAQVADLVVDGVITDEAVQAAADLLPSWMKTRPVSYGFVAQPSPEGLVVNHIHAGFGRFPSRFLDMLPPEAYASVRATLDGVFPHGFAEYRPVQGFNPNLHPLLSRVEIGEDPRWADHTPDAFELCHDQERDELRLRRSGTVVDVLYLGHLPPDSLPGRVAALHADLACGAADLSQLRPFSHSGDVLFADRLRYRDVLLARRTWEFSAAALDAAEVASVTRFRASRGLPGQVFVGPKPQYVDLTNALHLRDLPRLLTRCGDHRVQLTEALPVPSGQVLEIFAETYRRAE